MAQYTSIQSLPLALGLSLGLALSAGAFQATAAETAGAPGAPAAAEHTKALGLVTEHCVKCHGSEVYTRPDRKVTSRDGLERQVRRCETALELTWFDEDIAGVAGYLNQQYYHFK
jgi:mono/diheme cytochrome c family protein